MTKLAPEDQRHADAAEGWLLLGDWLSANAALEEITPSGRATAEVLSVRTRIYVAAGKWESALEIGGRLADSAAADAELLLAVAQASAQIGDTTRAGRWVKRAVSLNETPEFKLRVLDEPLLASLWRGQSN